MANYFDSNETVSALMPKKKVVYPVSDYSGQCIDCKGRVIDSDVAVCCRCRWASGGNTSNLLSHMRVHHPTQCTEGVQSQEERKMTRAHVHRLKPGHPSQNCSVKLSNTRGPPDDGVKSQIAQHIV